MRIFPFLYIRLPAKYPEEPHCYIIYSGLLATDQAAGAARSASRMRLALLSLSPPIQQMAPESHSLSLSGTFPTPSTSSVARTLRPPAARRSAAGSGTAESVHCAAAAPSPAAKV